MKQLVLFIGILLFSFNTVIAQQIRTPLADKEKNVVAPPSPGENYTWVKPHWEYGNVKYEWVAGKYIETKKDHVWHDAYWERNQKTGWWVMNPGYWQRQDADLDFKGGTEVKPTGTSEKKTVFINMKTSAK